MVHESGWKFNQIICIARGGLRVGDVLSRIYELPLAILSTHSYTAEGGTMRGQLIIAEHMTMTAPRLGRPRAAGRRHGRFRPYARRGVPRAAAALSAHHRHPHRGGLVQGDARCSSPTTTSTYLPDNPWIHQPFEVYDTLRPEGSRHDSPDFEFCRHAYRSLDRRHFSRGACAARSILVDPRRKRCLDSGNGDGVLPERYTWCPEEDSNLHSVATART